MRRASPGRNRPGRSGPTEPRIGSTTSPLLLFALLPAVLSLLAALLVLNGPWMNASILLPLLLAGFAMFFAAQISVIRRGRLVSLVSAGMTPVLKAICRIGYAAMGAAAVLIIAKAMLLRKLTF